MTKTVSTTLSAEDFFASKGIPFQRNVPLKTQSTWKIGGPADFLVEPSSWEQVRKIFKYACENRIPAVVIGKGSNFLFDDAGLRGVVIKIGRKLSTFSINGTKVRAEGGIAICRLARAAGLAGLTGLEHTIGIPGTLGGLIVMNGGSQRKSIGDIIRWVKTINRAGNEHTLPREECDFSYRHSVFEDRDVIVVEAEMELGFGAPKVIWSQMLSILRERRAKFPLTLPNCGSVFKSTQELYNAIGPPGKVIEDLGLKGLSVGEAAVSERHANFIVNLGAARSEDVLQLIHCIRDRVYRATGVWMQCEVQYVSVESSGHASQDTKSWPRHI